MPVIAISRPETVYGGVSGGNRKLKRANGGDEEDVDGVDELEYEDADSGSDAEMRDLDDDDGDANDNDKRSGFGSSTKGSSLVTPGELITEDTMWMRGHGTFSQDEKTFSSVAGTITRVNKLLSVTPLRGRYQPVIGDHVIGRITEVGNKRWKVDIGGNQDAALLLGSVNLPGGVLRRKSESDELQMRQFLKEGDLLNAEVQALFSDGGASLHTRSLRYGKLRNGMLVQVPSSLIIRLRTQLYRLPGGVDMILGINGYIWLSKSSKVAADVSITRLEETSGLEIYSDTNEEINTSTRENIARYANCIRALAFKEVGVNETRLIAAYEASLAYASAGDLIEDEVKAILAAEALAADRSDE
ncbi:Rrp4p [Sugiyamaella lignohabitans]|uniref:Rrp4p n=1 Tax=Sugiyamaella lignohabitans TaxID=796027 RepID=A0A167CUX2_9ASCO|nr:Rrp4p [Sugiyamaella lignohabitans]ANB12134.1 Rrp4p [Sugiyamaella lignohabitans]